MDEETPYFCVKEVPFVVLLLIDTFLYSWTGIVIGGAAVFLSS